ncbi:MAG: winged helix-turn-helix transcriptional regulator [Proteobacteria bacterium]|nr:winged helix-turn-helix transcriptional regulator [Pseudomonadota bacterium]
MTVGKKSIRLNKVAFPLDVEEYLPHRIITLANQLSRHAAATYSQPSGLSFAEWRLMAVVGAAQPISVVAARRDLGVDKAMASRLCTALTMRKLIVSSPRPRDRRRTDLYLTKKGAALHDTVARIADKRSEKLLACITPAERRDFDRVLTRLRAEIGRQLGDNGRAEP